LGFQTSVPGGLGVTVFFGISGYIITRLLLAEYGEFGNVNVRLFYKRRFWKIAPPLFFIVIVPSVLFWNVYSISIEKIISQVFFYFNWEQLFGQSGQIFPPSGVVWSLSIEEQFYIGIAAIILTLQLTIKNARTFVHLLTATVCLTWFLSTMSRMLLAKSDITAENFGETGNLPRVFLGTDTRISSICAGAVVAILSNGECQNRIFRIIVKHRIITFFLSMLLLLTSLTIRDQYFRDTFRYTLQEVAISLLIISGPVLNLWPKFIQRTAENSIIQVIGKSSYSLYLSHPVVLLAMNTSLSRTSHDVNVYIWAFACGIVCILIGIIAHRLFDLPFERKRLESRRAF
jgi:peptidoglycan/LPS O-acetylase OafA/YrhL